MKYSLHYLFIVFFVLKSGLSVSQVNEDGVYDEIDSLISIFELDNAENILLKSFTTNSDSDLNFGDSYYRLSAIYKKRELYTLALQKVDSALFFYNLEGNENDIALSNLMKGKLFNRLGQFSEGLDVINKAYTVFDALKDTFNVAVVKLNLGNIYKNMNNVEKSSFYYREAIVHYSQLGLESKVANCYNNLGNVFRGANDLDSSLYYYNKAMVIRAKNYDLYSLAVAYHNFGDLYLENEDYASALYYTRKAIEIKLELNDENSIRLSYYVLGNINYNMLDYEHAINNLKLSLINTNGMYNENISDSHSLIGKCYYHIRNYKLASYHFNENLIINDSIRNRKNSSSLEKELIKYEIVKDSLTKSQLIMKRDLSEIEKNNLELKTKISQNKSTYLLIGLMISLLFGILLFLSFRKRLKLSNSHKKILEDQNEELKRTLISKEEKETLLKEVHHRVKNNLQIINSLIRLQAHYTSPTNYKTRLADTENRIRSMALVHEKLYKSQDLSKLDSESYIIELTENLFSAYEFNKDIKLSFDITNIKFSIDTLIPLGLIVNETISNSLKYAFTGLEGGCIAITLVQEENVVLKISDNGIGADLTYEELSEDSLGMELIESLCEQLNGEFELNTEHGFSYTFTFDKLD